MFKSANLAKWMLALAAAVLTIPFLGNVHLFDWDEINFAECAREMLITQNYGKVTINFEPFYEKPPLYIWMQALSMKLFGVNEFAARFPNALLGVLLMPLVVWMGTKIKSERFGLLWAGAMLAGLLSQFYFHSAIIDPWFNTFMFLGIASFIFYQKKEYNKESNWFLPLMLSGIFTGLAVLTKGPVGLIIVYGSIGIYALLAYFTHRTPLPWWQILFSVLFSLLIPAIWFGFETLKNGPDFIYQFIIYQIRLFSTPDAGHGGFIGYHFVVVGLGMFPVSMYAIWALKLKKTDAPLTFRMFFWMMVVLLALVLILFSIVKSKIVHYSSMSYWPITFLAAFAFDSLLSGKVKHPKWILIVNASVGGILSLATFIFPVALKFREKIIPLIDDKFAQANIQAADNVPLIRLYLSVIFLAYTLICYRLIKKEDYSKGIVFMLSGSAILLTLTLWTFIGKVESLSQRSAINYCKQISQTDAYLNTVHYKSYAHYFYGKLMPNDAPKSVGSNIDNFNHYLLSTEKLAKPAYFIVKTHNKQVIDTVGNLKLQAERGGFSLYLREQ